MNGWTWLLLAAALPAALYAVHRGCLWLEKKGQLFYRDKRPTSSTAASCVALMQFVDPSAERIVEVVDERIVDDSSGEGDEKHRRTFRIEPAPHGPTGRSPWA